VKHNRRQPFRVDPIWNDDTWAPENDRDDVSNAMAKSAHRACHRRSGQPSS
jgi:hypothetical protein